MEVLFKGLDLFTLIWFQVVFIFFTWQQNELTDNLRRNNNSDTIKQVLKMSFIEDATDDVTDVREARK